MLRTEQGQRLAGVTATVNQVRALRQRKEGWNGYNALPPDPQAVAHAESWIREMHRHARSTGQPWRPPHVTASAEGEVVFEWWHGQKTLTVYLTANTAEYVKGSGPEVDAEVEDGEAATATSRQQLWTWLSS